MNTTSVSEVMEAGPQRSSPVSGSADIGTLLDDGPYTGMQKIVVLLAALSIVMDGFDGQLIGFAIPLMIKEWGITREAFAPAVAAGLIGMGIGSACAGLFADRFGRRMAVIASVILFGTATCAIGLAPDALTVAALRFIAGLGIGGALPSATTMTAEFTPARRRTLAVTATIVCVPLGGMLAGLFASHVLPLYGWRTLFFIGGSLPIVLGLLLLATLPESPRFLARRPQRWGELTALLGRMGRPMPEGVRYTDALEQKSEQQGGFRALFAPGYGRDTVAVWVAFFMCLTAVYSAFSWLPTMLLSEGLSLALAGSGLTAYNLGGVIGALLCAVAMTRWGSFWPLLICCAGGAASAFAMQVVDVNQNTSLLIFGFGVHGLFVNAVQSTLYALCAFIYPTAVRATGTASALAFGRMGAILSAFVGATVITQGGAHGYLTLLGTVMVLALIALVLVRRHIPRRAPGLTRAHKESLADQPSQP
ncbi:MFS transporter [Pseudomonas chlororaphis]|uniref:MFS transporter n=1 Tax=Pseudomonas chlororaphis TaxID=587753 RepID=UPI0006A63383|nr:MFS transporter [Pseudomonas chlororaphis]AZD01883.1 4-hydroxybenzoate transporter [Pseudomonas chlororaphis subsp. chlororaphis]MBM0283069.1 MFS transporter [Pseudomonas chlororaphis]MDO1507202.1 MFS transporter [Pseudomonas chlororaphis]ORM45501.1 MFS transporter [Pseudomonas chlororaphis subsp. chlororaphis]TWR98609.1 MFS transporter [Pseudomonas chlororaphis subsp. chlororaphis]